MLQLAERSGVGTFGCKGADVQLVDHRLLPRPAFPARVLPWVRARIDHLARTVDVLRLEARGRIGHELAAIDAVVVERPGAGIAFDELEPAFALRLHGLRLAVDHEVHGLGCRRPQAKAHAARREHFRAEGHGVDASYRLRRGHQRSRNSAAHSRPPRPKASARAKTTPARRMRNVSRTMSPPMFIWSSAISTTNVTIA